MRLLVKWLTVTQKRHATLCVCVFLLLEMGSVIFNPSLQFSLTVTLWSSFLLLIRGTHYNHTQTHFNQESPAIHFNPISTYKLIIWPFVSLQKTLLCIRATDGYCTWRLKDPRISICQCFFVFFSRTNVFKSVHRTPISSLIHSPQSLTANFTVRYQHLWYSHRCLQTHAWSSCLLPMFIEDKGSWRLFSETQCPCPLNFPDPQ